MLKSVIRLLQGHVVAPAISTPEDQGLCPAGTSEVPTTQRQEDVQVTYILTADHDRTKVGLQDWRRSAGECRRRVQQQQPPGLKTLDLNTQEGGTRRQKVRSFRKMIPRADPKLSSSSLKNAGILGSEVEPTDPRIT
ncbi:hypothetical protein NDU88_001619 [Pleurodeles waltl]|uniref:Uncharacterized protein n=1 Tax=Pleurodeles waltl TaxID=8319 RepID=A0AAV7MP91_PLEWA|nr:hypothetical protein NDU88_001619 [Pleurodeles waltl]